MTVRLEATKPTLQETPVFSPTDLLQQSEKLETPPPSAIDVANLGNKNLIVSSDVAPPQGSVDQGATKFSMSGNDVSPPASDSRADDANMYDLGPNRFRFKTIAEWILENLSPEILEEIGKPPSFAKLSEIMQENPQLRVQIKNQELRKILSDREGGRAICDFATKHGGEKIRVPDNADTAQLRKELVRAAAQFQDGASNHCASVFGKAFEKVFGASVHGNGWDMFQLVASKLGSTGKFEIFKIHNNEEAQSALIIGQKWSADGAISYAAKHQLAFVPNYGHISVMGQGLQEVSSRNYTFDASNRRYSESYGIRLKTDSKTST